MPSPGRWDVGKIWIQGQRFRAMASTNARPPGVGMLLALHSSVWLFYHLAQINNQFLFPNDAFRRGNSLSAPCHLPQQAVVFRCYCHLRSPARAPEFLRDVASFSVLCLAYFGSRMSPIASYVCQLALPNPSTAGVRMLSAF